MMSLERAERPTVAVILAGGTGQRFGASLPKQLLKVSGKTILEHTLDVFEACEHIGEILVMMNADFIADAEKIVAERGYSKVTTVLPGGDTRADTTRAAIAQLGDRDCNILLHDAVRPLVDDRILRDCVTALNRFDAIDVAIPSADTIIAVDSDNGDETIADIPDRARLRRGQTPQGFTLSVLRRAYEIAATDPDFTTTDDCGVVRRYLPDVPIHVVAGSEHNMKITHPIDIYLADRLFQLSSQAPQRPADPAELRTALAGRTMVVFGASYGIGASIARLAEAHGANVARHSRSESGVHVEDPVQVDEALRQAHNDYGRIDYVVNTAGSLHKARLEECDDDDVEHSMRVNFLAPIVIARASLPYLRDTRGSLLLFTSSSYTRGRAGYSLYSSAKAGIVNLVQALADEWADTGVRINCVNPERTATPMRTKAFGVEPSDTLLSAEAVAHSSVDVLISPLTGHVVDVRRATPGSETSEAPA
ncbi:2-C-methyl-D-erythritol 4-phosphate cytidylyltransferase [Stackebrandtia endophytica]|uniref:2-C-methyl-D-erythritol 4-phosphate cytidylyltransferase n=2 Tax=Stackebrandtia endophytica TaxID=1496996 RepID=A0A543AZK6_9ACTN|nr:bifunctional cytidylyltransferase/SDR family oxidoreductase [Stackebrandtia endophytica]TQL78017.1 2-C-methyl-D-erythritol 4-phosphate cytidylyltransferase [Stackebrandtia endophytica]